MPELPEVETMVRGIRPAVEGHTLVAIRSCGCRCRPISIRPGLPTVNRRLRGATIERVRRLGKRVVMETADGSAIAIEPRMTGLMLLEDPPDRAHLRLEFQFGVEQGRRSVWFWDRRGLGTMRFFGPGELDATYDSRKLGRDALDMDLAAWKERCARTSRPIKLLLLDQKMVAGIGNLYASEILHLARLHPARPSNGLTPRELRRLCESSCHVLDQAIVDEGSTLSDATYRTALNQSGRYQNKHRVYGRARQPCGTCAAEEVQRIVQGQRSTFFCPACQPMR